MKLGATKASGGGVAVGSDVLVGVGVLVARTAVAVAVDGVVAVGRGVETAVLAGEQAANNEMRTKVRKYRMFIDNRLFARL